MICMSGASFCIRMVALAQKNELSQAKELVQVEQELIEAKQIGSEQATHTSVEAPQPQPQQSRQQEPQQHGDKQSFGYQPQQQQSVHIPASGSGGTQHMTHAPGVKSQAPPYRNWAAQQPAPAAPRASWPPLTTAAAPAAPPVHQPAAHQPVSTAYTVEEPESPVNGAVDTENDAEKSNTQAAFQPTFPSIHSTLRTEEVIPPDSWHAAPPGAQDNATHVLMRKVECKVESKRKGVPTAPQLRVREVYTRIDPSGERQTMAAERSESPDCRCFKVILRASEANIAAFMLSFVSCMAMVVDECRLISLLCRVMQARQRDVGHEHRTAVPCHQPSPQQSPFQPTHVSAGMKTMANSYERGKVPTPTPLSQPSQPSNIQHGARINGTALLPPDNEGGLDFSLCRAC